MDEEAERLRGLSLANASAIDLVSLLYIEELDEGSSQIADKLGELLDKPPEQAGLVEVFQLYFDHSVDILTRHYGG